MLYEVITMLTLEWLKSIGGIKAIEKENEKKAQLIYSEIDLNPLFKGFAVKEDRSIMNATFTLANEDLKETFDTMVKEAGITGINGHRSVGGYRASIVITSYSIHYTKLYEKEDISYSSF